MCLVDVIWLECVCAFVCLYEHLACRQEADQALRISSVTAHQDLPLSLFWHLPLITALQLFDCSFIIFCPSLCLEGNDVTTHKLCEFKALPKEKMEKFSVCLKRVQTQSKTLLWVCASLYIILLVRDSKIKKQLQTFMLWWKCVEV